MRKSRFGYREIQYLGVVVDNEGIRHDPQKLVAVEELRKPTDVPSLRRFLGTVGYFRKFIARFAERSQPLNVLLRKDAIWKFGKDQELAFEDLRSTLSKEPVVLTFPRDDWGWVLDTDASGTAIAAVLQQFDQEGRHKVVAYASRVLSEAEQKWSIRELEAFAIVLGILHFAKYLQRKPFTVRTDHESLKWLWKTTNKRVARWALSLQEFDFTVQYRRGTTWSVPCFHKRLLPARKWHQ